MVPKREYLITILNNYYIPRGYKFYSKGGGGYLKETDKCIYKLFFNFQTRSNRHSNSTILIHHKIVEDMMIKVGQPNRDKQEDLISGVILNTLQDKASSLGLTKEREKLDLVSQENFEKWGQIIIDYMLSRGEAFLEKYSELPNVLGTINQLEDSGEVSYIKIMAGGMDHLFRVLIIAKLCGDLRYLNKQERFDEIFSRPSCEDWLPFYNDLKSILETTDPIYTSSDVLKG